ncbi:aspartate carbamoyltransferase, partial [Candidatus Gottesmanbacteria bacterium]|nr:aspartate carbamoyltransferase [Candidatus Gottesmanbacteria bacterium]
MNNRFFGHDLISVDSLKRDDVELLFQETGKMEKLVKDKGGDKKLEGKIIAALFYEPSSRTFSSFITAIQRLGGGFIPLNGMMNTSVAKGESFADTVKVFSAYSDLLVIRHPQEGTPKLAAEYSNVPVINAGDGSTGEHPTQALVDLYTIKEHFGEVNKLQILMVGDLAHYRPTNSLAKLLTLYPDIQLSFAAPEQVSLPKHIREFLAERKISFREYTDYKKILPQVDVLYVTRVKKEYMSEELYRQVQGSYIIDRSVVECMKNNSIIMHCLPRVGEIETSVD